MENRSLTLFAAALACGINSTTANTADPGNELGDGNPPSMIAEVPQLAVLDLGPEAFLLSRFFIGVSDHGEIILGYGLGISTNDRFYWGEIRTMAEDPPFGFGEAKWHLNDANRHGVAVGAVYAGSVYTGLKFAPFVWHPDENSPYIPEPFTNAHLNEYTAIASNGDIYGLSPVPTGDEHGPAVVGSGHRGNLSVGWISRIDDIWYTFVEVIEDEWVSYDWVYEGTEETVQIANSKGDYLSHFIRYSGNGFYLSHGYTLKIDGQKSDVDVEMASINEDGVLLYADPYPNDNIVLLIKGQHYPLQPVSIVGPPINLSSPEVGEPLRILCQFALLVQKRDPSTGDLVPPTSSEAFDVHMLSDLVANSKWSEILALRMSHNGAFIVGVATYTDPDTQQTERRAVMLFEMGWNPVAGEGLEGMSLCFHEDGSGNAVIDPFCDFVSADVSKLDPNGPINQVINPAGIVIESQPDAGNVAIFEIEVEWAPSIAEERLFWTVEGGGNAQFYPANDPNRNRGKSVKLYGVSEGSVLLKVRVGSETGPVIEQVEALVVPRKVLPYRVNLLNYEGNPAQTLPHPTQELPGVIRTANMILRQAGIELVLSGDDTVGDLTNVLDSDPSKVSLVTGAFQVMAAESIYVEDVEDDETENAISINYKPGVLQITFVDGLLGAFGRNPFNSETDLAGSSISAPYKTSLNDTFAREMAHTLTFNPLKPSPFYSELWGVLIGWAGIPGSPEIQMGGYTVAHEIGHTLNLRHRFGNTSLDFDSLEVPYNGKLLGPYGSNLMDYIGGTDIDVLQAHIMRSSKLLQNP